MKKIKDFLSKFHKVGNTETKVTHYDLAFIYGSFAFLWFELAFIG